MWSRRTAREILMQVVKNGIIDVSGEVREGCKDVFMLVATHKKAGESDVNEEDRKSVV
jgi:hypothetical protein